MTWGKPLTKSWTDPKTHFFIGSLSICNKIKLTEADYIQYTKSPENICNSCITELQKGNHLRIDA